MTVQSLDGLVGSFIALDILHENRESQEKELDCLDKSINVIETRIGPQAIMAMRELGVEEQTIKDKLYFHFKSNNRQGELYLYIDPINVDNSKLWTVNSDEVGKFIHHYLLRDYHKVSETLFALGGAILGGVAGYAFAYIPPPSRTSEFLVGSFILMFGVIGYTIAFNVNANYYHNLSGKFKPLHEGMQAIKAALKERTG
jgi:hypothetical protein